jgi:hypothetical protein
LRAIVQFRGGWPFEEYKLKFPSVVNPPTSGVLTLFLDSGSKMFLNWSEIQSVRIAYESADEEASHILADDGKVRSIEDHRKPKA